MKSYTIEDLTPFLPDSHRVIGSASGKSFNKTPPVFEADADSLVWINPTRNDKKQLLKNTTAEVIICDPTLEALASELPEKCLILVDKPKMVFLKIVAALFVEGIEPGIHETAIIHPDAKIAESVYIGPYSVIGKCIIGKNSVLHGSSFIYDNVIIGEGVEIHAGCTLGADGFGYARNDDGKLEKFPHIGGIVIGDDVEIGANSCIDCGTLGNTIIGKGCKIDNHVQIGHNVLIGEHSAIAANVVVGGSSKIGSYCWIAPTATIRDVVTVADKATVGVGAVIMNNVPEGETWIGNPATSMVKYARLQSKLARIK